MDITAMLEDSDESLTIGPPYNIKDDILTASNNVVTSKSFPIILNSIPAYMIE